MKNVANKIRPQAPADAYDSIYAPGGPYDCPYHKSFYYPLYRAILSEAKRLGTERILEVGCGNGNFAQMVFDRSNFDYLGFDFNKTAIERARERTGRPNLFFVGNALKQESYQCEFDTVICNEVLEHIEDDQIAISRWRAGSLCVCSVPNFDYSTHVRYFRSEEEITARYGQLIEIDQFIRIKKPVLRGQTARDYLRQLRWSRDHPARLLAHLGYRTFENLAGWFVFSGYRR